MEEIILSGNCGWCLEALFKKMRGISKVESGYVLLKSYGDLAFSDTDKIEVVKISYSEFQTPLLSILNVYKLSHNPTINPWIKDLVFYPGTRPSIIYQSDSQKTIIDDFIISFQNDYTETIHTKVLKFKLNSFVACEEKNQDYYEKNPNDGYCTSIVEPKLNSFKEKYPKLFKNL